ncbi:MAG: hypothetical protein RLZZ292_2207 [Bacteroidota bacterium]|jgi:hypothetical protein
MQILSLDIQQRGKPADIAAFFKTNQLKRGDQLNVYTEKDMGWGTVMIGIVILSALAYLHKKKDETIADIAEKYNSTEEIQAEIASDYGIDVVFESKKPNHAIDALFGVWADKEITLTQLRNQAWQRKS